LNAQVSIDIVSGSSFVSSLSKFWIMVVNAPLFLGCLGIFTHSCSVIGQWLPQLNSAYLRRSVLILTPMFSAAIEGEYTMFWMIAEGVTLIRLRFTMDCGFLKVLCWLRIVVETAMTLNDWQPGTIL
jgi:hypothetical protein